MTSRQHQDWINRGRPDSGLVRPLAQLRDVLRAAGWTVYDQPNNPHLDATPPEDHTYYSETGWPHTSPKWWRHAIDIMPGPGGAEGLYDLGMRIAHDRGAGRITWLKYINRPSVRGSLSSAIEERWEPGYGHGSSGDTGHIHISSVTGCETLDAPYNPLGQVILASTTTEDNVSAHTDAVVAAWSVGSTTATDGTSVEPVKWRVRDEAWQAQTTAALAALSAHVGAPPAVDVQQLAAALAAAGIGQVDVAALATALATHLPSHITLTGTVS